ncbi:MAG: hypothetical protein E6Q97_18780 [Desulfurellales bacterium]|nr:MAG: hypothetical protein E6Q97_18780 [Desulfurellales bacterium]
MSFQRSKGWQAAFTQTGGVGNRPLPGAVWEPCAHCWGQRVIWHRVEGGYASERCPVCRGAGVTLVLARTR